MGLLRNIVRAFTPQHVVVDPIAKRALLAETVAFRVVIDQRDQLIEATEDAPRASMRLELKSSIGRFLALSRHAEHFVPLSNSRDKARQLAESYLTQVNKKIAKERPR